MAGGLPALAASPYSAVGWASWYGGEFHGRRTSDGEAFDADGLTAAHKTMPIPCYARVTNLSNGRSVVVRVNDRGPFVGGRLIDVSARVASLLDFRRFGVAKVKVDYVGKTPPAQANADPLLANLRTGATNDAPMAGVSAFARAAPADDVFARLGGFAAATRAANAAERVASADPGSPYGELPRSPYGDLAGSPFRIVASGR